MTVNNSFENRSLSSPVRLTGRGYHAVLDAVGQPLLHIEHPSFSATLSLDICVDSLEKLDVDNVVENVRVGKAPSGVEMAILTVSSKSWHSKSITITMAEDGIELQANVAGEGINKVDNVLFFRRHSRAKFPEYNPKIRHLNDRLVPDPLTNTVGISTPFESMFAPEPNSYARWWFEPFERAQISPHSDLDHCGGNFIFNPGPLCFIGKCGSSFVSLGIIAPAGERGFTDYVHLGGSHLGLCLCYWGQTLAKQEFRTPTLKLSIHDKVHDALDNYREGLRARNLVPSRISPQADWWREPIACGWGEQSYMGDLFRMRSPPSRGRDEAVYAMCTQHNYEAFVEALACSKLMWKTLVIDARWTIEAGTKSIDSGRWPDLPGFIARLHDAGKKVLLWWGAWDWSGLPDEWCIHIDPERPDARRNRPGRFAKFGSATHRRPIAPDPCNADYADFIAQRVRFLLSDEPGCCGADGFKVDHVSATPGSYGLIYPMDRRAPALGLDLLHRQLRNLYSSAKAAKHDALVIGQSPNPYFSDCQDLVRLGDIYSGTDSVVHEMRERAKVVRAADPTFEIDTDGWPMPSVSALLEYARVQPIIGVPSIYYATGLDATGEAFGSEVLNNVQEAWGATDK